MKAILSLALILMLSLACGGGGGIGGTSDLASQSGGGGIGGTSVTSEITSDSVQSITSASLTTSSSLDTKIINENASINSNIYLFEGIITDITASNIITIFSSNLQFISSSNISSTDNTSISFNHLNVGDKIKTQSTLVSGNLEIIQLTADSNLENWTIQSNIFSLPTPNIRVDQTEFTTNTNTQFFNSSSNIISQSQFDSESPSKFIKISGNILDLSNTIERAQIVD
jgi:hypothetical protein